MARIQIMIFFFIFVPELMTRYWGSTVKMWAM